MKRLLSLSTRRKLRLTKLAQMEADAHEAIDIAKRAWYAFIVIVDKIKASGLWRLRAKNWKAYVFQTWGFKNTSRLSQLRKALPYQKILEAENGNVLEAHIRRLAANVPVSHPLMPQAFALGNQVAASIGKAPTQAMYKRSLEVLEESDGDGILQVGEKTFLITDTQNAVDAVKETLNQVKRIATDANGTKHEVEVIARRRRDGTYVLESNEALPDVIKFKVYIQNQKK